jgi:nitroimidazol reductase NimA-like FMN-containing flavoprotein (pyridoxamine 5'-phosphate oxidase superfamily)
LLLRFTKLTRSHILLETERFMANTPQLFDPTPRSTVRRIPARGVYDRAVINAILDEALVCHVGFVDEGQPVVIPMLHARVDDRLYIHGSNASRAMGLLFGGVPSCVTVTMLDGLVLARSAFHHSLNYRSVVILAKGEPVRDRDEKNRILLRLVEHVVPGRWYDSRQPTERELNATAVVGFPLDESSAKIRSGPPKDDVED